MNQSNSNIQIEILNDRQAGDVFVLRRSISVFFRGSRIVVPRGFASDGASVPRFFWRIVFPPMDKLAIRAAIFHDYLYRKPGHGGYTRSEADMLFLSLMLLDGVRPDRALRAYTGVRLFGGGSWRDDEA
jgi:hypothetical protein